MICSNCIGGLIYHRLGLKFMSPTINLWMTQSDFLKFVLELKMYLQKELIFIDEEDYPIALLGDIKIHFNHYKNEDDAKRCWDKRKKRINFNNLFIIMYDKDGLSKKDLKKLEKINCRGKIVISNNNYPDLEYVLKIPADMNNPETRYRLNVSGLSGKRQYEKYFDFVTWLNKGN